MDSVGQVHRQHCSCDLSFCVYQLAAGLILNLEPDGRSLHKTML